MDKFWPITDAWKTVVSLGLLVTVRAATELRAYEPVCTHAQVDTKPLRHSTILPQSTGRQVAIFLKTELLLLQLIASLPHCLVEILGWRQKHE
eukprot:4144831-Amphidinium_carterae.3